MNKENIKEKKKHFLQEKIDSLSENLENIDTYLFMANINQSITESLYFKLKQINNDEYIWLNQEQVDACMQQYKEIISVDCQNECPMIEEYIIHSSDEEGHKNIDKFTCAPHYILNFSVKKVITYLYQSELFTVKTKNL